MTVRGGGDPELAREWLERAQRSWRRASAGTFAEEKWEGLEATVYRALRALLAARGGCAKPPREIERLWRRLSETTRALLDHAEMRMPAVSSGDRAAGPAARRPGALQPCGPATPKSCRT